MKTCCTIEGIAIRYEAMSCSDSRAAGQKSAAAPAEQQEGHRAPDQRGNNKGKQVGRLVAEPISSRVVWRIN